jgi:hypothetical protein
MKVITIKQPWASLICEGIKDIENRTWNTKFRGSILIHAGSKSAGGMRSLLNHKQQMKVANSQKDLRFFEQEDFKYSMIIGSVEIVDCVINHESIWADKAPTYNWVLANPILFPEPIPAKGKQSFWEYPNILAEPEENDGELFCHCQLPVKEINQVTGGCGDYRCRYCGGKWYK